MQIWDLLSQINNDCIINIIILFLSEMGVLPEIGQALEELDWT